MSLKGVKVNSDLIPITLETILGKKIEPNIRNNGGCTIHRYQVETDSILDIYHNTDGTTSFLPTGKSQEFANLVAEEVFVSCKVELPEPTRALYIKKITQEELEKISNYLEQSGCTINSLSDTSYSKRYEIRNSVGENIKIHYFNTSGALNFQGKGYSIYSNILIALDTLISLDEVLESILRSNNIENITSQELVESMKKAFVSSFDFINGAISNIISASFFLTKIENDSFTDYSWMVFPILKGFEGFLKKTLAIKGLRINKNFGEVFEPIHTGATTYRIIPSKTNGLNSDTILVLENCYNFIVENRHGIFHMDTIVNASRLINRQQALEIFNQSVEIIESSYIGIIKA